MARRKTTQTTQGPEQLGLDEAPASDRRPAPTGGRPWLAGMNEEQAAVIAHTNGPLYVGAVAGCGKTRAGVNWIARLVADGQDPARILAVTFSKKAADEMNDRLRRDLGITDARVGTWHSLCYEVLRKDQTPQGSWTLDDKDRYAIFIKDAVGYKYLDWKQADVTKVGSFIGHCKANLMAHGDAETREEATRRFGYDAGKALQAYKIADELCHGHGVLTFDDMLVFAARHLQQGDNGARWAAKWDYLFVDEAQDNSIVQIVIARALAGGHRNIMAVGDVAQAIYGFRGSSPKHLAAFAGEWGAETVLMNRNYRSGRAIVAAANRAIAPAEVRLPVEMVAMRDFDGKAQAKACSDLDDEGQEFTAWVKEHVAGGAKHADCTALFRTNAQSRALEEALLSERIPYVVVGGTSFYERREVKSLLAYLRVAADAAGPDDLKKCINAPFRYLGAAFVDRVARLQDGSTPWGEVVATAAREAGVQRRQVESANEWVRIIEEVQRCLKLPKDSADAKPSSILRGIVERTRYIDWLTKEEGEESVDNSRASNVRELVRVAERFGTIGELLAYIDESIKAAARQRKEGQGDRVLLMSIHRSKGLEWPYVWVVGCVDGILPHARAEEEEERRLFYVAVTRARDELVCSYPSTMAMKAGVKHVPPSKFLRDAGLLSAPSAESPEDVY